MIHNHPDFQLTKSKLIISTGFAFIQFPVSPDGLVLCSCCEKVYVEIKCLFNQRDNYISDNNFYLTKINDNIKLSKTRQYYYQIQTQIHVTKSNFCDVFVWTT